MAGAKESLPTYRTSGVVIDSNLLLLLFLGGYDRRQIGTNKRLAMYTQADFDLLLDFLRLFSRVITTPNILTEVSNLSNAIADAARVEYFKWFATQIALLREEYIASNAAIDSRWARFGLTDAVIAVVARNGYLVLTDDFRLSNALQKDGIDAVNFNHLRDRYMRSSR